MKKKKFIHKIVSIGLSIVLLVGIIPCIGAMANTEDKQDQITKVSCVGDSLTEGYQSSEGNKGKTAYPAWLQNMLGNKYEVKNFGKTSTTLMKKTDKSYWNTSEYTQSIEYEADIVIVMLGTNDSKDAYWNAEQYKKDAEALVAQYEALPSKPKVIFATSPQCYLTTGKDITAAGVGRLNTIQDQLITKNDWQSVDIYSKTTDKVNLYHTDKVHLTDNGYKYIAECMYEAITGKKAPIEDKITITHTQTTGTTNFFTYAEGKWEAGDATHTWSKPININNPGDTYYEVKFTGHAIDIYAGKNWMMGKVRYLIDGVEKAVGDLYNSSNINSTLITRISGLSEGEHTLRVEATGERNSAGRGNLAIDAAKVDVYYNRVQKESKLHGSIVDTNLQYTQDKYSEVKACNLTEKTLTAWKNDTVVSEISLASVDASYTNVKVESSDFTGNTGTILKDNIDLKFIKSVNAYTGMPGYVDPDRAIPQGSRQEANEVIYQDASTPMNIGTNKVQNVWVSIKVPESTVAGTYRGTIKVTADDLETPLTFIYNLEVADAYLPDATEFKDGFDIELWQNPYRVAEYYNVEPFSKEHFEILKPHMELYKAAGGHTITSTILEEAWAGQTYGDGDVKYPSMVNWTKKANGSWEFDYSDFDAWVTFNKTEIGIGDKIVCYSIAPWTKKVVYYDEATQQTVKKQLSAGTKEWTDIWTTFLNDFADHLVKKGWFEDTYIGVDERDLSKAAFDLIDSIERGVPTPTKLKSAGAMDGFVNHMDLAMRVDDLNVGSIAVKNNISKFEELSKAREEAGLRTTIYTCTGHIPGNFSLSAPGESYWTMMYSYSVGGEGYLRWAYDSWVANPLMDTTHNAFEAGDCFLVFPDEKDATNPVTKSSTRFEKMTEGVRDVNKLIKMREDVPSMADEIDVLMKTVKPNYASSGYYLTMDGKENIAADMDTIKSEITRLTKKYIDLKENGTTEVESVKISGAKELDLEIGKTTELQAEVLPNNVLNNIVKWSSSNSEIATVKDGLVTGLKTGKVVITADSNQNGEKKDSVTINVKPVKIDKEAQLHYYSFDEVEDNTVKDMWGERNGTNSGGKLVDGKSEKGISFEDISNQVTFTTDSTLTETWSISYWVKNTSELADRVSILSSKDGIYSIDARISANNAKVGVHVGKNSSDVLTFKYTMPKNQWINIIWTQSKENGLSLYVNGTLIETNPWTKTGKYVAPIDVLGATGFTGIVDELKVYNRELNENELHDVMQVKGLNLEEAEKSMYIGETYQISTNLVSDNDDKIITYISDNPEVASVDSNGLVTAYKKGTAVIKIENKAGGFKEEVKINSTIKLYTNSRIPQYELADEYLSDIEKSHGTNRQYLGQPDMVRTSTGRLITAYPVGHGHGPLVMKISDNNGETWTEKTDTPTSWKYSQETPTMYVLNLEDGRERIILITACPGRWGNYTTGWNTSYSDDNGETWTEYKNFYPKFSNGNKNEVIVGMASLIQLKDDDGNYIQKWMGVYHDWNFINYKTYLTFDADGNEQWSEPEPYLNKYRDIESSHQICEVGMFRSPDGNRIVALARSQSHAHLSTMFYSDDEGKTWSEPIEMQGSLAGERHKAVYDPISGRLMITFREIIYGEKIDSTWRAGDWVAWVGTYDDLMSQGEGQYRILLEQDWSQNAKSGDTGYAGVVVLKDGTFIMNSYGHWDKEFSENWKPGGGYNVKTDLCYIKQAKFKLEDIENTNSI